MTALSQRASVTQKKNSSLTVRFTPMIREQLERAAESRGMSASDYVRFLVLKDLEENK